MYFVTRKARGSAWSGLITRAMQMGALGCQFVQCSDQEMSGDWCVMMASTRVRREGVSVCRRCGWPEPDQVLPPSQHHWSRREKRERERERGATGGGDSSLLEAGRCAGVINTLCSVSGAAGARDLLCVERRLQSSASPTSLPHPHNPQHQS